MFKYKDFTFTCGHRGDEKGGGGSCWQDCSYGRNKLFRSYLSGPFKFKIRRITKGLNYEDINILVA